MATLSQTLQQNQQTVVGANGQLQKQAIDPNNALNPDGTPKAPTLQQLTGQAGLASAPTTPGGVGAIGGTPDQMKMAGTPQQKQASLADATNVNAQGPAANNLSTALRQQQVNSTATTAQQAEIQKSTDMNNMGQLGDRVNDLVNQQFQGLSNQGNAAAAADTAANGTGGSAGVAVSTATTINDAQGNPLTGPALTSAQAALSALRADPTNQNLMLNVNQALGYNVATQLSPAQINNMYQSSTAAIAAAGGAGVNTLKASDLVGLPNFGYSLAQLSSLLEVPQDQVAQMSVGDIKNKINAIGSAEMSSASKNDQLANSNNIGQAEQGLATKAGQQLSATGIRGSEANYSSMEQQITNADQINFGGKTYQVDDLLSSPTLSSIITNVISSGPDSDMWKQMAASEPSLMNFVMKNQQVLTDAANTLQQGAQTFTDTQTANQALSSMGGVKVPDTIMSQLVPNWGQLSASKIDPNSIPALQYAQQNPGKATGFATALSSYPQLTSTIALMTPAQLAQAGIGDTSNPHWNTVVNNLNTTNTVNGIDPSSTAGVDKLVSLGFSGVTSAGQLMAQMQNAKGTNALFPGSNSNIPDISMVTTNGQLDGAKLKSWLLANNKPDIISISNGSYPPFNPINAPSTASLSPVQSDIYSKVGNAVAGSTKPFVLSDKSNLNLQDLQYLKQNPNPKIDSGSVNNLLINAVNDNTNTSINKAMTAATPQDQISQLQGLLANNKDGSYNTTTVNNKIKVLQQAISAEDAAAQQRESDRKAATRAGQITTAENLAVPGAGTLAQAVNNWSGGKW